MRFLCFALMIFFVKSAYCQEAFVNKDFANLMTEDYYSDDSQTSKKTVATYQLYPDKIEITTNKGVLYIYQECVLAINQENKLVYSCEKTQKCFQDQCQDIYRDKYLFFKTSRFVGNEGEYNVWSYHTPFLDDFVHHEGVLLTNSSIHFKQDVLKRKKKFNGALSDRIIEKNYYREGDYIFYELKTSPMMHTFKDKRFYQPMIKEKDGLPFLPVLSKKVKNANIQMHDCRIIDNEIGHIKFECNDSKICIKEEDSCDKSDNDVDITYDYKIISQNQGYATIQLTYDNGSHSLYYIRTSGELNKKDVVKQEPYKISLEDLVKRNQDRFIQKSFNQKVLYEPFENEYNFYQLYDKMIKQQNKKNKDELTYQFCEIKENHPFYVLYQCDKTYRCQKDQCVEELYSDPYEYFELESSLTGAGYRVSHIGGYYPNLYDAKFGKYRQDYELKTDKKITSQKRSTYIFKDAGWQGVYQIIPINEIITFKDKRFYQPMINENPDNKNNNGIPTPYKQECDLVKNEIGYIEMLCYHFCFSDEKGVCNDNENAIGQSLKLKIFDAWKGYYPVVKMQLGDYPTIYYIKEN